MTQKFIVLNVMLSKRHPSFVFIFFHLSLTAWPGAVIFITLDGTCFLVKAESFCKVILKSNLTCKMCSIIKLKSQDVLD